jgi:hypothetical protein
VDFDPVGADESAGELHGRFGGEGVVGGSGLGAGEDDGVALAASADEGVDEPGGGGTVGAGDVAEDGVGLDRPGEMNDGVVGHWRGSFGQAMAWLGGGRRRDRSGGSGGRLG